MERPCPVCEKPTKWNLSEWTGPDYKGAFMCEGGDVYDPTKEPHYIQIHNGAFRMLSFDGAHEQQRRPRCCDSVLLYFTDYGGVCECGEEMFMKYCFDTEEAKMWRRLLALFSRAIESDTFDPADWIDTFPDRTDAFLELLIEDDTAALVGVGYPRDIADKLARIVQG